MCSFSNIFIIIEIVRPRWTVEPTDKQFAQGSDAKVDCKADGFPQPTISWQKAIGKYLGSYEKNNIQIIGILRFDCMAS